MDEPSAVLAQEDLTKLFALIRRLREENVLIFYISHRLDELYAIADRVTASRTGCSSAPWICAAPSATS